MNYNDMTIHILTCRNFFRQIRTLITLAHAWRVNLITVVLHMSFLGEKGEIVENNLSGAAADILAIVIAAVVMVKLWKHLFVKNEK